jgi:L-lysine exporter family protein LysE/ArgO
METFQIFAAGFAFSLSLCLDIGIVNTAVINTSVRKGFLPAFLIGFGSCFGDLFYATLSLTGLVALLKVPFITTVIWIVGNILLLVLIIRMIIRIKNDPPQIPASSLSYGEKPLTFFTTGLLLSLASPSSILWFVSIGGALIASYKVSSPSFSFIAFFSGFFLAGLSWSFTLALCVSSTRKFLGRGFVRWVNIFSIIILMLLSCYSIYNGLIR